MCTCTEHFHPKQQQHHCQEVKYMCIAESEAKKKKKRDGVNGKQANETIYKKATIVSFIDGRVPKTEYLLYGSNA